MDTQGLLMTIGVMLVVLFAPVIVLFAFGQVLRLFPERKRPMHPRGWEARPKRH